MNNLRNIFSKLNFRSGAPSLNLGKGPERDWKLIFSSAILLTVFVIGLSFYMFIRIDKGEIFVVERRDDREGRILDVDKLRATVDYYQDKAQEFERLKSQVTQSPDPSL